MSTDNRTDNEEYEKTIDSILNSVKHITSDKSLLYNTTMANSASGIMNNNFGGSYTITTAGTNGSGYSNQYTNTTLGHAAGAYTFTYPPSSAIIDVKGDDADIRINGKSLKEFMEKVEERLLILQPDPKKLEKYAALRKAYEHYKLMEKLVGDD